MIGRAERGVRMRRIAHAAGTLIVAAGFGVSMGAASAEPLALRAIMESLGRDMQSVAGAIAREDWPFIERTAPRIAQHRQPPALEKARILGFVGTNAGRFRSHDETVRLAALGLGEAARNRDAEAVIRSFAALQQGCHGCHAEFRAAFKHHFEGR